MPPKRCARSGPRLARLTISRLPGANLLVTDHLSGGYARVCPLPSRSFILSESSGSNSVVECDLAKVEVAGSNPVSRSNVFFARNISIHLVHDAH